jgi:hypothetical protein
MICDSCAFYDYDEDYDSYICRIDFDEDELIRFMQGNGNECPYYNPYDEYKIVNKQN